jgi:integrase
MDQISRADARAFKTALADNRLMGASKTDRKMGPATVDKHIRNARTIFNQAVNDDIVLFNPFDRLSKTAIVERDWPYVTPEEYQLLMEAASQKMKLLIALCRLAALRRGEPLALEWSDIDWANCSC